MYGLVTAIYVATNRTSQRSRNWHISLAQGKVSDTFPIKRINGNTMNPKSLKNLKLGAAQLLGFVVMLHSDDYTSLFVSLFDIPMSFGSLLQRITPVYDRLHILRLN